MAEESTFGGGGRLINTHDLNRVMDSLTRTVQRMEGAVGKSVQLFDKVSSVGQGLSRSYGSGAKSGFGSGHTPGVPNGGGASFSGTTRSTPTSHRADGPAQTGTFSQILKTGNGGHRGSASLGTAFAVGAGVNLASQIDNKIGQSPKDAAVDSRTYLTMGRMARPLYSGSWSDIYKFNGSAMNGEDAVGGAYATARGTGYQLGSSQFTKAHQGVQMTSMFNPLTTNAQAAANQNQFGTVPGFIGLRSVGIESIGKGGVRKTTAQIANDILKQVDPNQTIRSARDAQIFVDDPVSYLNQTLSNWMANGIVAPEQVSDIKENILGILKGRAAGMSFETLQSTMAKAQSGNAKVRKAANKTLDAAGIANTHLQDQKEAEAEKRQGTVQRLDGFEEGLRTSTKGLEDFHKTLNTITDFLGINDITGKVKGWKENPLGSAWSMISSEVGGLWTQRPSALGGAGGGLDGGHGPGIVGGWSGGGSGVGGGIDSGLAAGSTKGWAREAASGGGGSSSSGKTYPSSGFGGVKPWVARAGHEMKRRFGISVIHGVGARSNKSDHPTGHALDFMTNNGGSLAEYARSNADRLGVSYVIWAQRIWSRERNSEGWRSMEDRGSVTANHFDHVHISFQRTEPNPGAAAPTGSGSKTGVGTADDSASTAGASAAGSAIGATSELAILQAALMGGGSAGAGASVGASDMPGGGGGKKGGGKADYTGISGGGNASANQALGRRMASRLGWGSGRQWQDLVALWNQESGWNHQADNPTSSAYGIPQALIDSPGRKMPSGYYGSRSGSGASANFTGGDPKVQISWGLDYIKDRYGNPSAAWAFHKKNNWYEQGAWEVKQDEDARVHKGEMVVPKPMADTIRATLLQQAGIGGGQGGAGLKIEFAENSINVTVGAGATAAQGRDVGRAIVSAIVDDKRIQALQNGNG